jgi:hypothetical protein
MMVAALFVEPKGVYSKMTTVDLWDEVRDARQYAGPHPVWHTRHVRAGHDWRPVCSPARGRKSTARHGWAGLTVGALRQPSGLSGSTVACWNTPRAVMHGSITG